MEKKAEGAHNRLRWPLKTSEAEDGAKFMTCRAGTGRPPPPDRATNPGTLCLATYSFLNIIQNIVAYVFFFGLYLFIYF